MVVAVLLLASKGLASDFWLNFFWLLQTQLIAVKGRILSKLRDSTTKKGSVVLPIGTLCRALESFSNRLAPARGYWPRG